MGMPMPHTPITTVDEYFALPEDRSIHDELLDGVYVVTPQPTRRHEMVVSALFAILHSALGPMREFSLFGSHGAVVLGPESVVEPDLFVVPRAPAHAHWRDGEMAILVVEVLSHGTARRDRGIKRQLYQQAGVKEYWIVDPDARLVERWRPGDQRPEVLQESISWMPSETAPGVTIDLPAFFAEVLD